MSGDPRRAIDAAPPVVPGWEVIRAAGRGGMGVVYEVRETATGRTAALKVLESPGSGSSGTPGRADEERAALTRLRRFLREGRAHAQVDQHPHVVRIFASGETTDGRPYILLEWLAGGNLEERLEARGATPLPLRDAATLVGKLASALAWVHAHGLVHRDLKPANVLFDERGEPRLADFGLVRPTSTPLDTIAGPLTKTGVMLGTPPFMAPEQVRGEIDRQGPHTDLWALGVILYRLVTGRLPFEGREGVAALYASIVRGAFPPPSSIEADLPPEADAICERALTPAIADRYARAEQLAADLGGLLAGGPVDALAAVARKRRRRALTRAAILVGAVAAVAAAGVSIGVLASGDRDAATATAAGPSAPPPPPPVSDAEALAAGDYLILDDAARSEALGKARSRLGRALAALTDEDAPDAHAAAVLAERAREPVEAVTVLRVELAGLLGRDHIWTEIAGDDAVAESPLLQAATARCLADRGRSGESQRALEAARAAAVERGLGPAVERVFAGTDGAGRWLARQAMAAAILAGRTGLEAWEDEAERLFVALSARSPESGAAEHARAVLHLERGELDAATERLDDALRAERIDETDRGRCLVLRARVALARDDPGSALADVREGLASIQDEDAANAARLVEVRAAIAVGEGELAVDLARDLVARRGEVTPGDPSARQLRPLLEARVQLAAALAAAGRFDEAAREADDAARALAGSEPVGPARLRAYLEPDAEVARDPWSPRALMIRGAMRAARKGDERMRDLGIRDLVRAAASVPGVLVYVKETEFVSERMNLSLLQGRSSGSSDSTIELDSVEEGLYEVIRRTMRTPRGDRPSAQLGVEATESLLARAPLDTRTWVVRAICLFELDRRDEARAAMEVARRLEPETNGSLIIAAMYAPPEAEVETAEVLVLTGVNSFLLSLVEGYKGGLDELSLEARERLLELAPLMPVTQRLLMQLGGEQPATTVEAAAAADGGDDPLLWHLIGVARLALARRAADPRPDGRRATEAFARAADLAEEHRPVHRAGLLEARIAAGLIDEETERLLDEAIAWADASIPALHVPRPPVSTIFVDDGSSRIYWLAHSRSALRAVRARIRMIRGDREGARADAEAAAARSPIEVGALAEIYERLQDR